MRPIFVCFLFAAAMTLSGCRRSSATAEDPLVAESQSLLAEYIRIDTSNPPGNESAGARFLMRVLEKEGIECRLIGRDPARQSLYARVRSGHSGDALLLMHHIDVVPAIPSEWTVAPFSGERANGYLWGRGALDDKSLGIAELLALRELKRRHVALRRDVVLLAVADEEMGGGKGTEELLRDHPDLFSDVRFALNEGGTNRTVVDRAVAWGIEVEQKQALWLRLTARGGGGHASTPDGSSAIDRLLAVLDDIRKLDGASAASVAVAPPKPDDLFSSAEFLRRDTVVITGLHAGGNLNAVPASASADLDCRVLPHASTDELLQKIRTIAGTRAQVEVLLQGHPVESSSPDTALFRVLTREMRRAAPGSRVVPVLSPGTTDARFLRARGVQVYGIAPFKMNYYDGATIHGTDERIRIAFFTQGVEMVRRIVENFASS